METILALKACFKCGVEKPLTEFNLRSCNKDGHQGTCKECVNKVSKDWYAANTERRKKAGHDYQKSDKGRANRREISRRWRQNNPEKMGEAEASKNQVKYKARYTLNNAIKKGEVERRPCEVCGEKAQAHHDDYSQPLKVRWLCPVHHAAHHSN